MPTAAQIAANQRNAQQSTGPRTDAGKARTRQNALRHGLCAVIPLMNSEMPEEAQLLLDTLRDEHQPVGAAEEILVHKMAEHLWFGKRASYLLAEKLDAVDRGDGNTRDLALMLRYHTTSDRGYYKAFNQLRKLQKERQLQEIGSVSQPVEAPQPATPKPVAPTPEITPNSAEFFPPTVQTAPAIAKKAA